MLPLYQAFVSTSSGFRKSLPTLFGASEVEKLSPSTARDAGLAIEFYHWNGTTVQWFEKPTQRGSLTDPISPFLTRPRGMWL